MTTIAEALREEMIELGRTLVWSGDPDLCLGAYERTSGRIEHPLNRIQAVLKAAKASPLFVSAGAIRACDRSGSREIRYPVYKLREQSAGEVT